MSTPTNPSSAEGPQISTFLVLPPGSIEAAAALYTSLLPTSQILISSPQHATISLSSQHHHITLFSALPGLPSQLTSSTSLQILCSSQAELDAIWERLVKEGGGEEERGGWVRDRWGVWWQVVPRGLGGLLGRSEAARRVLGGMGRVEGGRLREAARGDGVEWEWS